MRDETADTAAGLSQRLAEIERESGVRLVSVGDRVRRAFTAPLEQDELEAIIDPAVAELFTGEPCGAGATFETRAQAFLGVASGAGVEVPEWLERLTDRVDRSLERADGEGTVTGGLSRRGSLPDAVPWLAMPWEALRDALAK
jgi:hypothetical protein